MYAPAPTERVHTLQAWLQQIIIERIHSGGVKASPPILARIHSALADSMLGYEQCKCAFHSIHCRQCQTIKTGRKLENEGKE
jgi:hypothetical protein